MMSGSVIFNLRRFIDPNSKIFNRSRRIRSHNFFRFKSILEFIIWLKHFNRNRLIAKINWDKIDRESTLIILNNFNRFQVFKEFMHWVESLNGRKSYIILDNNSSFPPLLEYYKELEILDNCQILYLGYNSGLKGIADLAFGLKSVKNFIISDVDLVPFSTTPRDIIEKMREKLDKYPQIDKVGASLEIKDIPKNFIFYRQVMEWEQQFWPPQCLKLDSESFLANTDTTFAMYRNFRTVLEFGKSIRLNRPYTLKHPDWYIDPESVSDEILFYIENCLPTISTWTSMLKLMVKKHKQNLQNLDLQYEFLKKDISNQGIVKN